LTDYATLKKWKCLDTDTGKDLAEEVRKCHIPIYPGEVWSESQGSILLPRRRSAGVPAIENDALPTLPANSPDAGPLRTGCSTTATSLPALILTVQTSLLMFPRGYIASISLF
jgi:hypothetical protein